jgi:hypothetical protein
MIKNICQAPPKGNLSTSTQNNVVSYVSLASPTV